MSINYIPTYKQVYEHCENLSTFLGKVKEITLHVDETEKQGCGEIENVH